MSGRSRYQATPGRRQQPGPVQGAFLECGPYRWLVVPLGGLAFAVFVFVVGLLVGL